MQKKHFKIPRILQESGVLACNFSTYTPERNINKLSRVKTGFQREIFLYVPPAPQPRKYYSPVMSQQLYYLLSPTDATILLHTTDAAILLYTTDATIYSRPALLTKIEQGTYITFDASAPVLICLNTSCLNTSLVFCPGKGPSFFSHVPSHQDQTYAL